MNCLPPGQAVNGGETMRLSAVRNRNLSLWQSAIGEVTAKFTQDNPKLMSAMQLAASLHASAAAKGVEVAPPVLDAQTVAQQLEASNPDTLAYVSKLVFDVARAHQSGNVDTEVKAMSLLKDFTTRHYASIDILGWMQCVWRYLEYYVAANRKPPYVDWAELSPPNINFGLIDYKLPSAARILLLGDWATHMSDNVAMLREGLKAFTPDVIIHLGDVYYSGTKFECTQNVLQVMDDLVTELKIKRPPFFSIPGNHEYYSGGSGFFDMIANVNSGIPGCLQRASYFCLRTEDDAWQFLGMDTGYNDRDPVNPTAPGLQASEIKWHRDKLDRFSGTTVLLSHHQLFSAHEKLGETAKPYLNEILDMTFRDYYDRIAAWYWGHEHNFVVFEEGQCGLRKGRLIGCSAYEKTQGEDPYAVNFAQVAYAANMKKLGLSKYQSGLRAILQSRHGGARCLSPEDRRKLLRIPELGQRFYSAPS